MDVSNEESSSSQESSSSSTPFKHVRQTSFTKLSYMLNSAMSVSSKKQGKTIVVRFRTRGIFISDVVIVEIAQYALIAINVIYKLIVIK